MSIHSLFAISSSPKSLLHWIVDVSIAEAFVKSNDLALKYRRKVASLRGKPAELGSGNACLIFSRESLWSFVSSAMIKKIIDGKDTDATNGLTGQMKGSDVLTNRLIESYGVKVSVASDTDLFQSFNGRKNQQYLVRIHPKFAGIFLEFQIPESSNWPQKLWASFKLTERCRFREGLPNRKCNTVELSTPFTRFPPLRLRFLWCCCRISKWSRSLIMEH